MPVQNYFPRFHRLKSGAYSYVWTDKCERLLPKHYKERCLDYMMREPTPVHWKPDLSEFRYDKHGTRIPVQNHPVLVKYPDQCNKGLWAGEGIIECYTKKDHKTQGTKFSLRTPRMYTPNLVKRQLYSEILDKWFSIPCTNRAMDQIDDVYGLDHYILGTHERDLNSKLAMDLRRKMLIRLASKTPQTGEREKIYNRYSKYRIPFEEAKWVGLSIEEALATAEKMREHEPTPFDIRLTEQFLKDLESGKVGKMIQRNQPISDVADEPPQPSQPTPPPAKQDYKTKMKGWWTDIVGKREEK